LGALSLGRSLLFDHPLLDRARQGGEGRPLAPEARTRVRFPLWRRLRKRFRADALIGLALGALIVLIASILAMTP
ncbi:MAG: hypothetical protein IJ594_00055, partial [Oscillospiraceae bacterium]|nr:hypothetical protein [Oscillospiraceae bacterium]